MESAFVVNDATSELESKSCDGTGVSGVASPIGINSRFELEGIVLNGGFTGIGFRIKAVRWWWKFCVLVVSPKVNAVISCALEVVEYFLYCNVMFSRRVR